MDGRQYLYIHSRCSFVYRTKQGRKHVPYGELVGTTECMTLYPSCRTNHGRYNRVRLYVKYEIGTKWEESGYGRECVRGKTVVYRTTQNYHLTAGNALDWQSNLLPESDRAKPPFTKTTTS